MPEVRVLRNEDVKRVVAFIPPGHRHVRFAVFLGNEVLVFQEATINAIVRAFTQVALHPRRRALSLKLRELTKAERKEGYAKWQLIEEELNEGDVLREVLEVLHLKY